MSHFCGQPAKNASSALLMHGLQRVMAVDSGGYTTWVLASELLYVLDEGRAAMVLLRAGIDPRALGGVYRNSSSGV